MHEIHAMRQNDEKQIREKLVSTTAYLFFFSRTFFTFISINKSVDIAKDIFVKISQHFDTQSYLEKIFFIT